MDKIKSRFNSFSGKITLIVMLGISLIAVTVSFVVLVMSRQVFTKNYGDSQEKVFEQIEKEFNDFHDHIQNVFDAIDSSWAFRLYFNETSELDNTQEPVKPDVDSRLLQKKSVDLPPSLRRRSVRSTISSVN